MARRKTDLHLQVIWRDEEVDHPASWDYKTLLGGDPFTSQGSHEVRLISFTDSDDTDVPEQV